MKISLISDVLDVSKLNNGIASYKNSMSQEPYLFMNIKTVEALIDQMACSELSFDEITDSSNFMVGMYKGYRIYLNHELDFGEVEIR
jgi:hypothetical protein